MKVKLNALAFAAAAVLASAGAHAITLPSTPPGSGSVVFVAMDATSNVAVPGTPGISLTIDLGLTLTDFLPLVAGVSSAAGSLSAAGSNQAWDFASNAAFSAAFNAFKSAVAATPGDTYTWGVFAADRVSGTTLSPGNVVANYNFIATGNSNAALAGLTSAKMGAITGQIDTFMIGTTGVAGTYTSGGGFLGTAIRNNFGGQLPANVWSILAAPGATQSFTWANQQPTTKVYSLGDAYGVGAASDNPATFTFTDAGVLTYSISAVPEPGTYAMLLAGLGVFGFIARRRNVR